MRRLVDPGKPALRSLPREKEDFFIAANNNHLLAFENISFIPTWTSDLMCQLSTGGGHSRREPYTAMDETTFDAQKPQVLNGIEDFVIRGDLADAEVRWWLKPIEKGRRGPGACFGLELGPPPRGSLAPCWMRSPTDCGICRQRTSRCSRAWRISPSGRQPARPARHGLRAEPSPKPMLKIGSKRRSWCSRTIRSLRRCRSSWRRGCHGRGAPPRCWRSSRPSGAVR